MIKTMGFKRVTSGFSYEAARARNITSKQSTSQYDSKTDMMNSMSWTTNMPSDKQTSFAVVYKY